MVKRFNRKYKDDDIRIREEEANQEDEENKKTKCLQRGDLRTQRAICWINPNKTKINWANFKCNLVFSGSLLWGYHLLHNSHFIPSPSLLLIFLSFSTMSSFFQQMLSFYLTFWRNFLNASLDFLIFKNTLMPMFISFNLTFVLSRLRFWIICLFYFMSRGWFSQQTLLINPSLACIVCKLTPIKVNAFTNCPILVLWTLV